MITSAPPAPVITSAPPPPAIVSIPPSPVIVSTPAEPVSVQASLPSSLDTSITLAPVALVSPDKSIVTIPSLNNPALVVTESTPALTPAVIDSIVVAFASIKSAAASVIVTPVAAVN